jgi:hypothetical protein
LRSTIGVFRSQALSLPAKYAPRLVGLKTPGEARALLDEGVRDMLTDLSNARIRAHPPKHKIEPGWEDWVSRDGGPD